MKSSEIVLFDMTNCQLIVTINKSNHSIKVMRNCEAENSLISIIHSYQIIYDVIQIME
jgi:hypothetical protein